MAITDNDFKTLMSLEKIFEEENIFIPARNEKVQLPVLSCNEKESFVVDIDRSGKIEMKSKLQERYLGNIILIRIEINAPEHTNPDGTKTSRNHIHIYKEGFNLAWAYDLENFDVTLFKDTNNFNKVFIDFCSYCNIDVGGKFQLVI